jgi:hypothetical protein
MDLKRMTSASSAIRLVIGRMSADQEATSDAPGAEATDAIRKYYVFLIKYLDGPIQETEDLPATLAITDVAAEVDPTGKTTLLAMTTASDAESQATSRETAPKMAAVVAMAAEGLLPPTEAAATDTAEMIEDLAREAATAITKGETEDPTAEVTLPSPRSEQRTMC